MFGNKPQQDIPVVQGVALPSGGTTSAYVPPGTGMMGGAATYAQQLPPQSGDNYGGFKGEQQPKQFNDILFSIVFVLHLLVMAYFLLLGLGNARQNNNNNNNNDNENNNNNNNNNGGFDYTGVVFCVCICGLFAVALSTATLSFMMHFSKVLIQIALIFSILSSLAIAILGFMAGQLFMAILGIVSFALGCCYAYFVWARIPYAAANMNTALTAVKSNLGLAGIAYFFLALAFVWSIWWSVAAGGGLNSYGSFVLFLFLLSYYWTHQVLQNTVHVTTAGVVGTWWFVPEEANSFCSKAIWDSFARATTYSFGSICFGSLVVAIIQALRQLNHMLRDQEDAQMLLCIVDCILGCIESIVEYFNKWAYIYVGLYGYSYLEAGKNVLTLFQNKGWTAIITDDLVDNVLLMMSVVIGLVTGLIGFLITTANANIFANVGLSPGLVGFIIGFLTGFILASIMLGIVGSAVNTVIVCFAEAPNEFQTNHPELSNEMRAAWRQAWPVECSNM